MTNRARRPHRRHTGPSVLFAALMILSWPLALLGPAQEPDDGAKERKELRREVQHRLRSIRGLKQLQESLVKLIREEPDVPKEMRAQHRERIATTRKIIKERQRSLDAWLNNPRVHGLIKRWGTKSGDWHLLYLGKKRDTTWYLVLFPSKPAPTAMKLSWRLVDEKDRLLERRFLIPKRKEGRAATFYPFTSKKPFRNTRMDAARIVDLTVTAKKDER